MKYNSGHIIAGLVNRGVPAHVAQGVAMNFQDESGFDTGIQEGAPTSGRGGFGLAQWTGPRRIALEDYARAQGKPVDDINVQLDFFMEENKGPEAGAWQAVMAAPTANEAAAAFVNKWERPATQHAVSRTAKYMGGKGFTDEPEIAVAAGTPTPAPATGDRKVATAAPLKEKNWLQKALGGIGTAEGSGFMAPQPNLPDMPGPPRAALASQQGGPTLDLQQGLVRRQQLAEAMARLNSGKTWV